VESIIKKVEIKGFENSRFFLIIYLKNKRDKTGIVQK
jgi:hypothetical protein